MSPTEHRYGVLSSLLSGVRLEPLPEALSLMRTLGTAEVMADALARCGIAAALARRGFASLRLGFEQEQQPFTLHLDSERGERLVELSMWLEWVELEQRGRGFRCLSIETMRLQNPRAAFDRHRPRAPAQVYPGLGLARAFHTAFGDWAHQFEAEAVLVLPEFFHTALIISRLYDWVDPEMQGLYEALCALIREPQRDVVALSWALEWGLLRRDGATWRWPTEAQLHPLEPSLRRLLAQVDEEALQRGREARFALAPEFMGRWPSVYDGEA